MARPDDATQISKFIARLRGSGGSAGNYQMMELLGWSEAEYWRLHEKVVSDGLVLRGRGRGGTVHLVDLERAEPAPKEADLYEPCLAALRDGWAAERGITDIVFEITANQGSRTTGGTWTRPDIAAVSVRTFDHWPERVFDLWTFEVKPASQVDIKGVHEAAAHAQRATQAYVLYHLPSPSAASLDRLEEAAGQQGVGLATFVTPEDFRTWEFLVEPKRQQPDPDLLDEFIRVQMGDQTHRRLKAWR